MVKTIVSEKVKPILKDALARLVTVDFDFLVIGGLICQYYLKDHARYTKDIDIVYDEDREVVEEKLRKVFNVIDFDYKEARVTFFEATFTALVEINGEIASIEGTRMSFFKEIKPESFSYEGISYEGVSPNFMIADKIVSILNELERPYKHLLDIYSFSRIDQTELNKDEIRKYIDLVNNEENENRIKRGIKEYILPKQIPENKVFTGKIITTTLQAKYNITKEVVIEEVNKWLKTIMK